jgi:competence protein ComGC
VLVLVSVLARLLLLFSVLLLLLLPSLTRWSVVAAKTGPPRPINRATAEATNDLFMIFPVKLNDQ